MSADKLMCYICMEEVIKTDNINCTTCKCKGSIGHIHDTCLNKYINGAYKDICCKICNTKYTYSRNFIVNKLIPVNPNTIIKNPDNNPITINDIENSKLYIYRYYITNITKILIAMGLLYFNNFYIKLFGLWFMFTTIGCLRPNIYICQLLFNLAVIEIKCIELFTMYSIDYVDIILMSYSLMFLGVYFLISIIFITLHPNILIHDIIHMMIIFNL